MIRLAAGAVLLLAFALLLAWNSHLRDTNANLRAALDEARTYIATTKETDDALSDLPDDPDDVLQRLCELAPAGTC